MAKYTATMVTRSPHDTAKGTAIAITSNAFYLFFLTRKNRHKTLSQHTQKIRLLLPLSYIYTYIVSHKKTNQKTSITRTSSSIDPAFLISPHIDMIVGYSTHTHISGDCNTRVNVGAVVRYVCVCGGGGSGAARMSEHFPLHPFAFDPK